jgi:hypothetical protein
MAYDIGSMDEGGNRGARRLLALADHLETVPDRDYDHHTWRSRRSDGSWVMCALGHGVTALPDVIGLRWRHPDAADFVRLDGSGMMESTLVLAAEAFEISLDEATMMFGMGPYTVAFYGAIGLSGIKPKAVASAIRTFAQDRLAATPARTAALVA